jgi:hypothetical protein
VAVRKARVAEPGADREHRPVINVLHERRLAQPLNNRVVMQNNGGVVVANFRDRVVQCLREIEAA